jgi:hypothetical protein
MVLGHLEDLPEWDGMDMEPDAIIRSMQGVPGHVPP